MRGQNPKETYAIWAQIEDSPLGYEDIAAFKKLVLYQNTKSDIFFLEKLEMK